MLLAADTLQIGELLLLERDAICFLEGSGREWDYANVCARISIWARLPITPGSARIRLDTHYAQLNGYAE